MCCRRRSARALRYMRDEWLPSWGLQVIVLNHLILKDRRGIQQTGWSWLLLFVSLVECLRYEGARHHRALRLGALPPAHGARARARVGVRTKRVAHSNGSSVRGRRSLSRECLSC